MKHPRIVAVLLACCLVSVAFVPSATALTWTESDEIWTDSAGVNQNWDSPLHVSSRVLGATIYVAIHTRDGGLGLVRSNDGFDTFTGSSITSDAVDKHNLAVMNFSNMAVCYTSGGDLWFKRSSNGAVWFSSVAVETTATLTGSCYITTFGDDWAILYGDTTNTDLRLKISTDDGVSWGSAIVVDGNEAATGNTHSIAYAKKNETTGMVVYTGATSTTLRKCITTTSGATWTSCAAIPESGDNAGAAAHWVVNDTYDVAGFDTATDLLKWCRSESAGADGTWGCGVVRGAIEITNDPGALSVLSDPDDPAKVVVIAARATNMTYYQTDDAGATSPWFGADVRTFQSHPGLVDAVLMPNGNIGLAVQFCRNHVDPFNEISCVSTRRQDTAWRQTAFASSGALDAAASATVDDLVGFDVDPTGQIAIARTELGENVQVWNAQTLGAAIGGPIDTDCAAGTNDYEDAVMAKAPFAGQTGSTLVGYLSCTFGGDSNQFRIRTATADVPTADDFGGCVPVPSPDQDGCLYDIPLDEWGEDSVESGLGQLGQVDDFPIDYGTTASSNFGLTNTRQIAWAFASQQCDSPPGPSYCDGDEPGYVGVAMWTDGDVSDANGDDVLVEPAQDVNDFCLGKDGSTYYLASASSGQPSHTWQVIFDQHPDTVGVDVPVLDASIVQPPSGIGSGASAIACGGGQILIHNNDGTVGLYTRQGTFLDSVHVSFATRRGVAISEEFKGPWVAIDDRGDSCTTASEGTNDCIQFGAYVEDLQTVHIVNLTGEEIANVVSIPLPVGVIEGTSPFHSVSMDRTAQNVWIALGDQILRYSVYPFTTIEPVSIIPGDAVPEDTGSDDGLFAPPDIPGVSESGNRIIAAVFCMGIFMGTFGTIPTALRFYQGRRGAAAVAFDERLAFVGLIIGFVLSWQLDYLTAGAVFVSVLAAGGLIGGRLWKVTRG